MGPLPRPLIFGSTSGLGHVGSMLLSDWLCGSVAGYTTDLASVALGHRLVLLIIVNSENKPRGLYFQRPILRGLFQEGLMLGGAYMRREICVSKSARLKMGGENAS